MRARAFPLAAVLSAAFWVFATGVYGSFPAFGWGACLALGYLALLAAVPEGQGDLDRRHRLAALAAGALWLVCFDFPFDAGGYFLVAAALLGRATLRFGLLLVLQAGLWLLLDPVFAKFHDLPELVSPLAAALSLLGEQAAAGERHVSLVTSSGHLLVRPTWEGTQALFFALVLGGVLFGQAARGRLGLLQGVVAALITAAFALLRYLFNILLVLNTERVSTSFSPWVLVLSSLPLVLLLPRFAPAAPRRPGGRPALAAGLAGALCLALFVGLAQPGAAKGGLVLINEHNSQWERTTRPFDTRWYGSRAGYNYYCLADLLERYYDVATRTEPLDDAVLDAVDVLILKTPTAAYEPAEVDAIERFVLTGGSVLLVGDHTNVFGSSEFLNQVGERFGLLFNFDSQHRIDGPGMTVFEPRRRLAHPVVRAVPVFLFGTGCTLAPPLLAEDMVVGYANTTQRIDYASSNFFLTDLGQLDRSCGMVSQVAGLTVGEGRVLAFSDSTVFSNFWMYMRGKPEMLLGMMNWLNRENFPLPVKRIALIGLLVSLAAAILLARRGGADTGLLGFALGLPLAAFACDLANGWLFPAPRPRTEIPTVAFCREGCDYFLPRRRLTPEDPARIVLGYTNFYSLPIRVGLVPREFDDLEECLANAPRLIVLLNPVAPLADGALLRLAEFVAAGGALLIVAREDTSAAAADRVLEAFGLTREESPVTVDSVRFSGEAAPAVAIAQRATFRPLAGGAPLLEGPAGEVCAAATQVGRGLVVGVTAGDALADVALGLDSQVPTWDTLLAYRTCFWLFEGLAAPGGPLSPPASMEHYFGEDPLARIAEQVEGR